MFSVEINSLFIGFGTVIIFLATLRGMRLFKIIPTKQLRILWRIQIGLMVVFLLGYTGALWLVATGNTNAVVQLTAVIFALGALFVLLTVDVSVNMASKLATLNQNLESKVAERTEELSRTGAQLSANMIQLKTTQSQLLQSAKMASVGTLAAGIAHELNNPLAIISGYTELISDEICGIRQHQDYSAKIKKSVARMKSIINHLKIFTRDSTMEEKHQVDIRCPINEAIFFTKTELDAVGIKLRTAFAHGDHQILGDMVQLESVFQNLLINSRDAFRQVRNGREKRIEIKTTSDDKALTIIYKDNASGAGDHVIDHMFDPFFTTKQSGQGVGLGLSIVHEIVDQHNGTITGRDTDHGLEFIISFPISAHEAQRHEDPLHCERQIKSELQSEMPSERRPNVLVIDDEIDMCNLIQAFLGDDFKVNATSNPRLGLDLICKQKFDMIITDLRMPDVSGIDIIKKVQEQQPETPVIAITGFSSASPMVVNAIEQGATAILNKPFIGRDKFRSFLLDSMKSGSIPTG